MASNWLTRGPSKKVFIFSLVGTCAGGAYLLRDYFQGGRFEKEITCAGKVAVITGANSGIGKETAKDLARRGAVVFMLCRDIDRCERARKEIVLETRNKYVYARVCDLASLQSVREFSQKFHEEEKRLDILINNAGVYHVPEGKTVDGFEVHLGVNHMGHFLLTNLLLDLLKASAPSRIINVTSVAHIRGKINKEDLNSDESYEKSTAYNQSKLANVLFTKELAERLKGAGVTANAVHPGIAGTHLFRKLHHHNHLYWKDENMSSVSFSERFADIFLKPFMWLFFKSPQGGAQTVLYAALDPDLENVSGKYFVDCAEKPWATNADDLATAKWLWAVSEKWTRLHENLHLASGNDKSNDIASS